MFQTFNTAAILIK